jgi:glycerophosphoryl diester phosphodiesterase
VHAGQPNAHASQSPHKTGLLWKALPTRPSTEGAPGPNDAPFLVAHRAGNRLERLRASEAAGLGAVEADVNLFRGRLEVRHLKTVGPLPLLWDRWELASPWRPRLLLEELLATAAPATELMLDLKGSDRRLAERVVDTLTPYLGSRRLTISAHCWPLLEPFAELPVRRLHSVRTHRQLRTLIRQTAGMRIDGVSIHERLLDFHAVAELRRVAGLVLAWTVNDAARAAELVRLGIDGLISDRPEEISARALTEAAA